jgi:putative N-acetyltransferase (TIGR04045 family)
MKEIICRQIENDEERAACFEIRKQVFVDEQKLFPDTDLDEHDKEALHLAAVSNDKIIGTVRIYREEEDVWVGGRLAVKKRYRGKAGKLLVLKAVEIVKANNAKVFKAVIQADNVPFFINLKWKPVGEMFLHHGQMHQLMQSQF